MSKKFLHHIKVSDPILYAAAMGCRQELVVEPRPPKEYFSSLARIIIGQQLSGKAADAIWRRFEAAFPNKRITPKRLATYSEDDLRALGMAYAKARALRDLAEKTLADKIAWRTLHTLDNAGVTDALITIKGVGPWSIEMFLMFSLGREDIFSYGDLGLKKGIKELYELRSLPSTRQLDRITKKWSPYRTYAALVLWRHVDGPDV